MIAKTLPGVVLLINYGADGTLGYGSGVLISKATILTNLHVVKDASALGVMLYRKDRIIYSPLDGGLARYLFENETEVFDAELLRGDPINDLAVVKVSLAPQKGIGFARPMDLAKQIIVQAQPLSAIDLPTSSGRDGYLPAAPRTRVITVS